MKSFLIVVLAFTSLQSFSQIKWKNVDSLYQPLPAGVHIYFTNDSLDGKPNIAYYLEADLLDKSLNFTSQVGYGKRYKPSEYYQAEGKPLVVVNCTFFEFVNNSNLNMVVKDGRYLAYNQHTIAGRGKDTLTYYHISPSAIGINKKRKADVAWVYTDSNYRYPVAFQQSPFYLHDSLAHKSRKTYITAVSKRNAGLERRWKMKTAVGGGPVLLHNGSIRITNNEERKFIGKSIDDKHPRTAIGYSKDGKLIILMFQGRTPGIAEGATLTQEARVLQELGCWEALNLDGGGSSCLLVNGKETIKPSDKEGQRPVPAVFIIKENRD